MRPSENKPPAVRVGAFVACGPLADDVPTAEQLRSLMRDCLNQPEVMDLIGKLTDVDADAGWHSQPGRGRFNLEADLLGADGNGRVLASALVLLPEQGIMRYGKDRAGAELYLHVDLPTKDCVPVRAGIAEWHDRFTAALAIPGLLARFVERADLTASGDPAARFAVQILAGVTAATGLDEIVDFGDLAVLSPRRYSMQFDGWAVADRQGKAADAISRRFLIELCECTGRTGYEGILAELASHSHQHGVVEPEQMDSRHRTLFWRLVAGGAALAVIAAAAIFVSVHGFAARPSTHIVTPRPSRHIVLTATPGAPIPVGSKPDWIAMGS